MKPYEAGGGPGDERVRELDAQGVGAAELARMHGVARQTADYWRQQAGIQPNSSRKIYNHKHMIPWVLAKVDAFHRVQKQLTAVSLEMQGAELDARQRSQARQLRRHLELTDRVVAYDRARAATHGTGFMLVRRDPAVDAPGDLIRRPAE